MYMYTVESGGLFLNRSYIIIMNYDKPLCHQTSRMTFHKVSCNIGNSRVTHQAELYAEEPLSSVVGGKGQ